MFALIINLLYYAIVILLLTRIIFSFANITPWNNQLARVVFDITEPMLAPIRNILPPMAGLDFSPMIVLLAAGFLRNILIRAVI